MTMAAEPFTHPEDMAWPGEEPRSLGRRLTFIHLEGDASLKWYVARSATRREKDAERSLIAAGLVVYLPRLTRWRRHAGRKHKIDQPLLGGYLFVGVQPDGEARNEDLARVVAADGVHALVRFGADRLPMPVPFTGRLAKRFGDDQTFYIPGVLDILTQELDGDFDRTGKRRKKDPEAGEQIKVIRGMFQGFPARFVERTEDDRVKAFLTMFGKETLKVFKPEDLDGLDPDG